MLTGKAKEDTASLIYLSCRSSAITVERAEDNVVRVDLGLNL
jgi:hypothetical protein